MHSDWMLIALSDGANYFFSWVNSFHVCNRMSATVPTKGSICLLSISLFQYSTGNTWLLEKHAIQDGFFFYESYLVTCRRLHSTPTLHCILLIGIIVTTPVDNCHGEVLGTIEITLGWPIISCGTLKMDAKSALSTRLPFEFVLSLSLIPRLLGVLQGGLGTRLAVPLRSTDVAVLTRIPTKLCCGLASSNTSTWSSLGSGAWSPRCESCYI